MQTSIERVELAISELKLGKMVILTDSEDRENEGDLVIPAENITPEIMNFIIRHSSGIVCLSLTEEKIQQLNLPLMVPHTDNTSMRGTPFTISIDAKNDITTGVSALDRTITIKAAISENATADDLVKPGHIFPLLARKNGVLERDGHTEGSVDLAKIAGFQPAAVICEIMNEDGTMTRGPQLTEFAEKHNLMMLSINDIIDYRLRFENFIADKTTAQLPLDNYGNFNITVIKEKVTKQEHIILTKESRDTSSCSHSFILHNR